MVRLILQRLIGRIVGGVASRRVIIAIIAGAGLLVAGGVLVGPSLFARSSVPPASFSYTPGQPPPSAEAFLKGNQNYDAELIWTAYGQDAQERFRRRGGNLEEIRRQMAAARERGIKIDEIRYIGGDRLPNGTSMHFYVVRVQNGQTQGQQEHVPYVFTLDSAGKIARVQ